MNIFDRNALIYCIHLLVVIATAYFAFKGNFFTWYYVLIVALPLLLSSFPRLKNYSYTINVRILFPISIGLLCVCFFHYFPHLMIPDTGTLSPSTYGIKNDTGSVTQDFFAVNPIFKDAVSVLYAICAAFMLWKGLTDFDELKHVLYEEANEVKTISDYSNYFIVSGEIEYHKPYVLTLRKKLFSYLENMLQGNKIVANSKNEDVLEECMATVGKLNPGDFNDQIALGEIMKSLSRISVLRSHRTVCIEKKMSPFILTLMFMMSATMVASFFGKASGEVSIDYIYVFLLPAFYTSIFMTLVDLGSPFDGYWSIKLGAVETAMSKLKEQISQTEDDIETSNQASLIHL
ncbi:DUF4239 domain-containing protein [Amylibacter sp. SFDW26]|uniref:bestrophin-like domain n=1 Tax=Amylibacter sp. SFDW26 TaxID=2652722 RepID=UPI001261C8F9|nr:DUF4239 domain-containing protein [Amylibacter sp. SFDW26]KAB7616161.1 DUF4239 domain-containing protein [Amylibacter sp. SFDW26]